MYFYLLAMLTINIVFLGKGILYLLEKMIENLFIPLINWGYRINNIPYNLSLNKFINNQEDINDQIYENINNENQEDINDKKQIEEKEKQIQEKEDDEKQIYKNRIESLIDDKLD